MAQSRKTKQLLEEIEDLRKHVAELRGDLPEASCSLENPHLSKVQHEEFFENAPDMFVSVDPETAKILDCNQTAATATGYTKDEIIGRPIFEMYHPDCMDRVREAFQSFVETGVVRNAELQLKRKDGSKIEVMLNATSVRDEDGRILYSRSSWRDVSDIRRAERELHRYREELETLVAERTTELQARNKALRESEERLHSLFEGIDDAVLVHDFDGRILDCNSAACRRLKYSREELLAMRTTDIDSAEFAEGFKSRIKSQTREGTLRCEGVHLDKDGNKIAVDVGTRVIDFQGETAVLAVIRDMTVIKRAEEDRLHLEQQVQHTQKLESLGLLAGGIAHDFNNLLQGVLGGAELATDHVPPTSPAYDDLQDIQQAAKKATDLCRQMLAYAGKGRFVVEPINLNGVIRDISGLLETTVSKKVQLLLHLKEELPAVVADASQLTQIMMNLVANASEACEDDNGVVSVTTNTMHCSEEYIHDTYTDSNLRAGPCVSLEVSDTGCGMDEETIERMFDPFFTTKFAGRGLGLAAVLGIVRGHGGAIRVYSEPGRGSTFKILFPASEEEVAAASEA